MRRAALLLAAAIGLAAATPARAEVEHDARLWINLNAQGKIAGRALFYAEVQPRIGDDVSRVRQLLLRPAVGFQLSPRVSVWQGYAHVENPAEGRDGPNEERSFQQLSWSVPTGPAVSLSMRTRLEQRWQANGRDTGLRARHFVRAAFPVAGRGAGVAALAYGELFVALNSTDWGARSGVDQGRVFLGLDLPLLPRLRAEAGYLNQTVNQRAGRAAMNHAASFALYWRP